MMILLFYGPFDLVTFGVIYEQPVRILSAVIKRSLIKTRVQSTFTISYKYSLCTDETNLMVNTKTLNHSSSPLDVQIVLVSFMANFDLINK